MPEIRIDPPLALWAEWKKRAMALGLPLTQYVLLMMQGVLKSDAPKEAETPDPVQGEKLIRDRLRGVTGDSFNDRAVPALARQLGVPKRSLQGSIGSLVASKRLARTGDEYRWVKEEGK